MAVDAQRLLATGHRHPSSALGLAGTAMPMTGAAAAFSPWYGSQQQQGYLSSSSSYMGLVQPPATPQVPAGGRQDQYTEFPGRAAVDLGKRPVGLDGSQQMISAGYKRKRDDQSPALGAAPAQQQPAGVDRILLKHAANMWAALGEQRKRDARLVVSTVEARAAKRLKVKDEEIERARSMNWVLQQRLTNLYVEAQMWRDMARSNEAAADVLRGDLQQVLDAQAVVQVEDTGSCCGDEEVAGAGRCKGCGEGAAVVLLLPCSHLCVCASCADTAPACPACGCAKNGTLCVNFSS